MTTWGRDWNVALLQAIAAAAVVNAASAAAAGQSYNYVAYLLLTDDCVTMSNPKTGAPSRDRTYQAYGNNGQPIGAAISERVLTGAGGLSSVTSNPTSSSNTGTFEDQMGLSFLQSGSVTLYQYFVTTVAGTPWVDVPTAVQTPAGQYMVNSVTLSAGGGRWDASYNGDAGMWNADGSPRLHLCGR
jgi:hypothetical protein